MLYGGIVASRYLPRRSGGQYAAYDFAFFWMMGDVKDVYVATLDGTGQLHYSLQTGA